MSWLTRARTQSESEPGAACCFRLVAISPAAELPRVDLAAALSVCAAIRRPEPERFQRAALRWVARFCVEHPGATLDDVRAAAWAFERMGSDPDGDMNTLRGLTD